MKFYIKERSNPQLPKSYYIACGKMTKKEAKKMETAAYGSNYMIAYDSEETYLEAIEKLKEDGYNVN